MSHENELTGLPAPVCAPMIDENMVDRMVVAVERCLPSLLAVGLGTMKTVARN